MLFRIGSDLSVSDHSELWIEVKIQIYFLVLFYFQTNRIEIKRIECTIFADYFEPNFTCTYKPVRRNVYGIDIRLKLRETIQAVHAHFELFYRYTTYQRFLINRWEDACGFFDGTVPSALLDIIQKNFGNITNVNHTCPYLQNETIIFNTNSLNMANVIIEPLLPAGDFKLNLTFVKTEGKLRMPLATATVLFSVSDYRIWF